MWGRVWRGAVTLVEEGSPPEAEGLGPMPLPCASPALGPSAGASLGRAPLEDSWGRELSKEGQGATGRTPVLTEGAPHPSQPKLDPSWGHWQSLFLSQGALPSPVTPVGDPPSSGD